MGALPALTDRVCGKGLLGAQRREAALALLEIRRAELDELFAEVVGLPTKDMSLQVRLPRLLSPQLEAG